MTLQYVQHEKIRLKENPNFSEVWLHKQICDNPSILGLGDLSVIERERVQASGGRLDILLSDAANNRRYEVEVMLGATDPSHIIRCIEYWDIERRRYPAHDHIAVLIAEQVTTRFLNVMSLLAGSIPMIAIQLDALQVGDQLVLNFVKVLDQQMLREDDEAGDGNEPAVGRDWWESRKGDANLQLCDRMLALANEAPDIANSPMELKYTKSGVAIAPPGSFFNVVRIWPKKNFVRFRVDLSDASDWIRKLEEAGINAELKKTNRVLIVTRPNDFDEHTEILSSLLHQAVKEFHS
jgi:hypothetical protein